MDYQYNEGYGLQIHTDDKISSLSKHHIMKSQRRHGDKVEPVLEFDNKLRWVQASHSGRIFPHSHMPRDGMGPTARQDAMANREHYVIARDQAPDIQV
jgi:hypothetical protein